MVKLPFVDVPFFQYWYKTSEKITKTIPETHFPFSGPASATLNDCTGTVFKDQPAYLHNYIMDIIIFFKAIGNLLFAAILFLAVLITSAFSVLIYLFKGLGPALHYRKGLLFRRK
ncbi:hypothetical protein [Dyadobacter pollutisoli]|uniref:Uncharacterized protein n=1 Tax=Dyadobacter pollutisoli TaxID=2910158 RepID=A0A9E8SJ25_9BACT|nr:hypothetical protein [Dyadobacter pollutisoli]WAC09286.1 hypothetical protein ON006_16155 [Dyadobacter pollutisoli]